MSGYTLRISDTEVDRYRMMAAFAAAAEAELWRAAGFVPGAQVVDLGCGPGAVLVELARRVGRVVGVDQGEESLEVARKLIAEAGLDNAEVRQADAAATGLEPGTWDAVMIRHVLAHVGPRIPEVVSHIRDLLKPGGHAFLVDSDGSQFRFERPPPPELQELLDTYNRFLAGRGCDTSTGPHLGAYVEEAGLEVVARTPRVDAFPILPGMRPPAWAARDAMREAGVCTAEDIARWEAALDRNDADPQPNFIFGCIYTITARRP